MVSVGGVESCRERERERDRRRRGGKMPERRDSESKACACSDRCRRSVHWQRQMLEDRTGSAGHAGALQSLWAGLPPWAGQKGHKWERLPYFIQHWHPCAIHARRFFIFPRSSPTSVLWITNRIEKPKYKIYEKYCINSLMQKWSFLMSTYNIWSTYLVRLSIKTI